MRRVTVLAAAAAVTVASGLIGFNIGRIGTLQQVPVTSKIVDQDLVTGAIASQLQTSLPTPASGGAFSEPVTPPLNLGGTNAANPKLTCKNPHSLGVSRVVEIDTTGGPGFGFEHFKQHDFLRDKEVVLTFDDGPWPTTAAVIKALADECVLATFFAIGKHATYYPEILRKVAEAGHSVGTHTWSHQNLAKKSAEEARAEIEKAISAVQWALGDSAQQAAFFRFPALSHPGEMVTYLGGRNIAVFSTDMDSLDFKVRKPEQIIKSVMTRLQKQGKGIVLMHDFQTGTSQALPQLLAELKAGGYKIVHLKSAKTIQTLTQFDEELQNDQKLATVSQRPTSSVVRDLRP